MSELANIELETPAEAAPLISKREVRTRVLGLAWPVIGENFLETLLGIVDTLLVAGLGAVAIAGVGSALQVMFFMISALGALAVGSAVLVAQAVGAGDLARAGRLGRQSLLWNALFSLPLTATGFLLSGPIIGLFGLEPQVAEIGTQYLQVTMGTVVVLVLFLGAYAGLDGILALIAAVGGDGRDRVWYVLEGIIGIGLAILILSYPVISERALIYVIAAWAIPTGIVEILAGFELPLARDWLLALAGVLSVIFGVLAFANPAAGALAIVWLIGSYAILFGIVELVFGFRLRGMTKTVAARTA